MSSGRLDKDGRWIPEVSGTWEIEDRPDRWGPITAKREGLCNHCDEDQKVAHLPVGRTLTVNLCARCLKEALDLLEALDV